MATVLKWNGAALLAYGRKAASNAIKAAGTEQLRIAHQMASVPNTGVTVETRSERARKARKAADRAKASRDKTRDKARKEIERSKANARKTWLKARSKEQQARTKRLAKEQADILSRRKAASEMRKAKRVKKAADQFRAKTLRDRRRALARQQKRTARAQWLRSKGKGFL